MDAAHLMPTAARICNLYSSWNAGYIIYMEHRLWILYGWQAHLRGVGCMLWARLPIWAAASRAKHLVKWVHHTLLHAHVCIVRASHLFKHPKVRDLSMHLRTMLGHS